MLRIITALSGITSTTTSSAISVEDAKAISLQVYVNNVTGNGSAEVEVSNDGTGWSRYFKLISNTTNVNSTNLTRVGGITWSGNSTSIIFFEPGDTFKYVRITGNIPNSATMTGILAVQENRG